MKIIKDFLQRRISNKQEDRSIREGKIRIIHNFESYEYNAIIMDTRGRKIINKHIGESSICICYSQNTVLIIDGWEKKIPGVIYTCSKDYKEFFWKKLREDRVFLAMYKEKNGKNRLLEYHRI